MRLPRMPTHARSRRRRCDCRAAALRRLRLAIRRTRDDARAATRDCFSGSSCMIDTVYKIVAFAITLGVLVIFHEIGHYVVARLAGVKVMRFSVGFGRLIWSRRVGRDPTEWGLSTKP